MTAIWKVTAYPEGAWRLYTRLETLGTDTTADGAPALQHQAY